MNERIRELYLARAKLMYRRGHEQHSWMCLLIRETGGEL